MNSNPSRGLASGTASPLLLILGYANGIQVWMIPVSILSQAQIAVHVVQTVMFLNDVCFKSSGVLWLASFLMCDNCCCPETLITI